MKEDKILLELENILMGFPKNFNGFTTTTDLVYYKPGAPKGESDESNSRD